MTYQEKIIQLRQIINEQLLPLIDSNYAFLELPYYNNIGDTLIWEGSRQFLKQTKHRCLYSASLETFYFHKFKENDIILLQGGGNFGDLWNGPHQFRRKIINLYPNNRIIIFPQTTWYEKLENISKDEVFFASHPKVTLCARDSRSFSFMQEHFPKNNVLLVPDMAFFIDFEKYGKINRKQTRRVLFAKRTDKELKSSDVPCFIPADAEIHDWPTMERIDKKYERAEHIKGWFHFFAKIKGIKQVNKLIDIQKFLYYRREYIKDCISFINPYDTIYSTRLHIAIASAMMGKKVNIIDNTYGKNFSFYDTWLEDLDNIERMHLETE